MSTTEDATSAQPSSGAPAGVGTATGRGAVIDPAALAHVPALSAVLAWAEAHGGTFDGLRLALDAYGGIGIYAARDFSPGDTLAFVPHECALTISTARESAFGQRVLAAAAEWGMLHECTDELLMCLFLSAGRLDPSCERHHMIAAMPADSPEPCCWPDAVRAELAGTPVGLAVSSAMARFALYAARFTRRLAAEGIVPEQAASLESLLWARGMYHSRGYTGRLASPEAAAAPQGLPAADGAADGILLPIVDLMNHRHAQPITWQVEDAGVRFIAMSPIAAGEEVCTNYGARPNEELLFSYGFALREPASDAVSLVLAERRGGDADGRPRRAAGEREEKGEAAPVVVRHTHYVRRMGHGGIPASLLRALSGAPAACGEGDGGGGGGAAEAEAEGEEEAVEVSGEALELLLSALLDKSEALRPSAAADKRALKLLDPPTASSSKAQHGRKAKKARTETDSATAAFSRDDFLRGAVAVYRSGQRKVLKEAIAAVRELLQAAEGDGEEEEAADADEPEAS